MKPVLILILGLILVFFSCTKSGAGSGNSIDCSTVSASFSSDVQPVILSSCSYSSGCHGSGSSQGPGALLTYQQIYIYRVSIRSAVASGRMPENGSLSTAEKNKILCWIDNGTQDN